MPCVQSAFSALEVKMGRSGQDEHAGKPGITSDEKKGGVVSCGRFPRNARYLIFSVFRLRNETEPHFELRTEFPGMLCDSGR